MLDQNTLQKFENGLNPQDPTASVVPCEILGYGEISCVLQINHDTEVAAKRMPLFASLPAAQKYAADYQRYCDRLRTAGLTIPEDATIIVKGHGDIAVLYILQKQLPPPRFCHQLIQTEDTAFLESMIQRIVLEIEKVWTYNATHDPNIKLAIDGQLSNWVLLESGDMAYIDTSTPLMLEEGIETLDPELLLQSAPSFLRWLIRWQFLEDVMTRYYDRRLVYTDLIANLYKEQRPELVDSWIGTINSSTTGKMEALEKEQIEAYYKEDKFIWRLFLGLRRFDRFIKNKLLGQRYEFVLPGKIKR
ncbi:MAG: DUF6206 family protein [Candidatus Marinimicrobia bacterium]|nr:DUF6206 family protein [Candidatus Neomarinimicrobiota bacterium]MCF7922704.1 DUF6206 family protein [Candidatus Neomarinimicrobiota bacterium]